MAFNTLLRFFSAIIKRKLRKSIPRTCNAHFAWFVKGKIDHPQEGRADLLALALEQRPKWKRIAPYRLQYENGVTTDIKESTEHQSLLKLIIETELAPSLNAFEKDDEFRKEILDFAHHEVERFFVDLHKEDQQK